MRRDIIPPLAYPNSWHFCISLREDTNSFAVTPISPATMKFGMKARM